MKCKITNEVDLSIKELAKVLAQATPEEFADFWFEYSQVIDSSEYKVSFDALGKAMSNGTGGARITPFRSINQYMEYHILKRRE